MCDRISRKPEAAFSRKDPRFNPTPEEQSVAQMMEDLGDHRIVNLPLAGARILGTAPAPNPEKGGTRNSLMALKGDHMEAWAALFDPSLVIERNDGLGEGQSYRIGPNYIPITEAKFKPPLKRARYRSGSDLEPGRFPMSRPLLGASGRRATSDTPTPHPDPRQAIPSLITRTSLQIRSDLNKPTPPTASQNLRPFLGRPAGSGIPPKRVIPTTRSISPFVPLSSLAHLSSFDARRGTRKVPENPDVTHWHTCNLMTANQNFYDYIQSKTGANQSTNPQSTNPPAPDVGASGDGGIRLALEPSTPQNESPKSDSPKSIDIASDKPKSQKFVDTAPATVSETNGAESRQELTPQSEVAERAKIVDQKASEIAQVASQVAPKATSDPSESPSAIPDDSEPRPQLSLPTMLESLEAEVELTARALLECGPGSHDYEMKEIFNKARFKALTDKINAADKYLSEEMTKIYQLKTSLQDMKSRCEKMADDFRKIKVEHDEFMARQKRIAEIEAVKKAADELAQKDRLEEQRQMELRKEEQRLKEKQELEKQFQEEKLREERRQEEKRQEELRKEKLQLEAESLKEERLERRRLEKQRIEKRQPEGPFRMGEQPQKEKQRGLDRLRYEKQQLIEKHRLDKLLNDERIKAEQIEVRRLAAQRMGEELCKERQERKRAQNESEKILTRERLGGSEGVGAGDLDEYPDPYGRGRIEAENAHEKFREITQVRTGHSKGGPPTQPPPKGVPHPVGTQRAAEGKREMALPKEASDLDNGRLNPPLFPYKLHLQLTPLFNIPSITAWVGRLTDPTAEIEKAIRQHLSDDEMKVLKNVEAYKQFLARATDHHARKLAKDSK